MAKEPKPLLNPCWARPGSVGGIYIGETSNETESAVLFAALDVEVLMGGTVPKSGPFPNAGT
jgi:hypothetical protein